jgi:hypothetical protein
VSAYSSNTLGFNTFNFVHRNLIARAVTELGGPRRFMGSDLLSMLERAAILQIGCDPGCPESMQQVE